MKLRHAVNLAGIAFAVGLTSARASILDYTVDYGSQVSPIVVNSGSVALSLPQFNPALGTLNSVTVELFSHDTVMSEVLNLSGGPSLYTLATATVPISVSALAGLATSVTGTAGPFAGTAAPGVNVAGSATLPLQTDTVAPANFLPYVGTGNIPFSVDVTAGQGTYSGSSGNNVLFLGNGTSYGTVEIEYNYEGAAVPEPATWCGGLVIAGFSILRMTRSLRRFAFRS